MSIVLNEHFEEEGAIVFREACRLGCEGIVSKRLGSPYGSGRSAHWVKVKNPNAPAVRLGTVAIRVIAVWLGTFLRLGGGTRLGRGLAWGFCRL